MCIGLRSHRLYYVRQCDFLRQWERPGEDEAMFLSPAPPQPASPAIMHRVGRAHGVILPPGWELWVCLRHDRAFYVRWADLLSRWERPSEHEAVLPGRREEWV